MRNNEPLCQTAATQLQRGAHINFTVNSNCKYDRVESWVVVRHKAPYRVTNDFHSRNQQGHTKQNTATDHQS